jgi:hypothetical protein
VTSTTNGFRRLVVIVLFGLAAVRSAVAEGSLLRNADFQDEWVTLLLENLTLSDRTDGTLLLNDRQVANKGLENAPRDLYAARPDKVIFLEADRTYPTAGSST